MSMHKLWAMKAMKVAMKVLWKFGWMKFAIWIKDPGGDTSYKWANGDVPLDGVAFSRQD